MDFTVILEQMAMLFAVVIAGYISGKAKLFDQTLSKKMASLIINLTCPCLIIASTMGDNLPNRELIVPLMVGDNFDFTLAPNDAYGEYDEAGKQALPRKVFEINGKLDSHFIFEGAVVPLSSADGARFNGTIVEIGEESIVVDLNHPLAGKSLNFVGNVVESREASNEEIRDALNQITGCGGGCGGCGGGSCDGCESKDGGCGGCK